MDGRRPLAFSSLHEVMPDVDRLLQGHRTVGNWSLAQICNHLSGTFLCSIEGFTVRPPWLLRVTVGPIAKRIVFSKGAMPEGVKLAKALQPKPGLDDRAEAEALRATIHVFSSQAGPLAPHPMFGKLSVKEWQRLHCIHCAHHLSFVVPETVAVERTGGGTN